MADELQKLPEDTQTFLNNEIKKYNVADAKLAELKQEFGDLKISDVEDKEGYKKVTEAIAILRPLRTGVEKKRKELNEVPIAYKKAVDDEAKRLTALIEEIENPLKEQKDFIDAEKERIKQAEIQAKEEIANKRIHLLMDAGCKFTGTHYEIGEGENIQRVSVVDVRNMDDETFTLVQKGIVDAGVIIKQQLEQEQENARLESERIAKEKQDLEKQRQDQENERIRLEQEKHSMEQQRQELAKQLYDSRAKQLQALGYSHVAHLRHFTFKNQIGEYIVTDDQIVRCEVADWNTLFQEATSERIRLNDLQVQKNQKDEANRLAKEEKDKKEAELEKQRVKEEAEQLRQAQLPDVEKAKEFFASLNEVLSKTPMIENLGVQTDFDLAYNAITGAISRFTQKYPENEVK